MLVINPYYWSNYESDTEKAFHSFSTSILSKEYDDTARECTTYIGAEGYPVYQPAYGDHRMSIISYESGDEDLLMDTICEVPYLFGRNRTRKN